LHVNKGLAGEQHLGCGREVRPALGAARGLQAFAGLSLWLYRDKTPNVRFVQDGAPSARHFVGDGRSARCRKTELDMKPRIKVLTLAVSDLERSLAFYRDGLGLPTQGVIGQEFEDGAVVFFHLNDDLILALYPATSLGKDARITATGTRLGAVSIGHVVGSKEAVDAVMAEALRAGAIVTDPARDRFWGGYSGYFHDPDGHLWEIVWNPQWPVPG
jgi:uncharacterized protein